MVLTSTNTVDVVGGTQQITFFSGVTQVDQVTYSSNTITFASAIGYTLSKSDYLLYFQYLNSYFTLLAVNFPIINSSSSGIWPLCTFSFVESNVGVKKLAYLQDTGSTMVLGINYLPLTTSAAFLARVSPVTISMQEFFMTMNMLAAYTNQVTLN